MSTLSEHLPAGYYFVKMLDRAGDYLCFPLETDTELVRFQKEVNFEHIHKFGLDALYIYVYLLEKDIFNYLYRTHGNGD